MEIIQVVKLSLDTVKLVVLDEKIIYPSPLGQSYTVVVGSKGSDIEKDQMGLIMAGDGSDSYFIDSSTVVRTWW